MTPAMQRLEYLLNASFTRFIDRHQDIYRRVENVQWFRAARLGTLDTFGGPEHCRRVMLNCEQEMVARPEPWPWER
jgi:hypothetical protein